jgi:hypothetical protein
MNFDFSFGKVFFFDSEGAVKGLFIKQSVLRPFWK